jgi:predicted kinase
MEKALKDNMDVIVDRTNINRTQRGYFIELAQKYKAEIHCVEFFSSNEKCIERIQKRKNHKTITEDFSVDKITEIVVKFSNDYEVPKFEEGFSRITTYYPDAIERESNQSPRS